MANKLSYDVLVEVLESSANSGQRIKDKALKGLAASAEKEFLDVKRLHDDLIQRADEENPPPTGFMG